MSASAAMPISIATAAMRAMLDMTGAGAATVLMHSPRRPGMAQDSFGAVHSLSQQTA